jgi:hypothetical protein
LLCIIVSLLLYSSLFDLELQLLKYSMGVVA